MLFLIGSQKSGTTWLRNCISHVVPISLNQEWYLPDLYDSFLGHIEKYGSTLPPEDRDRALRESLRSAWTHLLDAATPGALADKSAYPCVPTRGHPVRNDLYPQAIRIYREVYPDCKIVLIVRDPRAVWNSWQHFRRALRTRPRRFETIKLWMRRHEPEYNPAVFAQNWQLQNQQWIDDQPDCVVRYEDLKSDFRATLAQMFSAVKIPVDQTQIDWIENCEFNIDKSRSRQPALYRKGQVDDWKQHLASRDVSLITQEACELMERLGYLKSEGEQTSAVLEPLRRAV